MFLSGIDVRAARRVVGYLEYGNALDSFEKLIESSDSEDLAAIDAIIGDRKEFTIFRELPPAFAVDQSANNDGASGSAKRGLAWILALARVEFGAVLSGFTEHPDPYGFLNPDSFGYAETMQLLLEGVASHYSSLKDEVAQEAYLRKNNNVQGALTLSRRLRIARAMLRPLLRTEESRYTSEQSGQLETAANELDDAQVAVNSAISVFMSQGESSYYDETTTRDMLLACGIQLRAEKREIAAGTARVTRYPAQSSQPGSRND